MKRLQKLTRTQSLQKDYTLCLYTFTTIKHFTDKETEVQKGQVPRPRSHGWTWQTQAVQLLVLLKIETGLAMGRLSVVASSLLSMQCLSRYIIFTANERNRRAFLNSAFMVGLSGEFFLKIPTPAFHCNTFESGSWGCDQVRGMFFNPHWSIIFKNSFYRERKTSVSCHLYEPCLGIEPATFWCMG